MNDLSLTLSKGHRAKLIPVMDCQAQLCYMSVIHLEAVTAIVKEIFDESDMIDLFLPYTKVPEQNQHHHWIDKPHFPICL